MRIPVPSAPRRCPVALVMAAGALCIGGCSAASTGARVTTTTARAGPTTTATVVAATTSSAPASSSTTAAPVTTTTPTTLPVPTTTAPLIPVIAPCTGSTSSPAVRPSTVLVVCQGTAVEVSAVTWSSWGSTSAYGLGTASVNTQGSVQQYPASIYVFGASISGEPVFQNITVTPTTNTGQVESSYMPGNWGVP